MSRTPTVPGNGTQTTLVVAASPGQEVRFWEMSFRRAFDAEGLAVVNKGMDGYTFTLDVPIDAIDSIVVAASGTAAEKPSRCLAFTRLPRRSHS
jgi:hypothetical protein